MKDPRSSYDNDAFEELMKQYLLEESANDRVADDQWMEAEANRVFAEEPVHVQSAAKEAVLVDDITEVIANKGKQGFTGKLFTILLAVAAVLFGLLLVFNKNEPETLANELSSNITKAVVLNTNTAEDNHIIGDTLPWMGTIQITSTSKPNGQNANVFTQVFPMNDATVFHNKPNADVRGGLGNGKKLNLKKDLLREMKARLELFTQIWPNERMYMHTDRNYYLPGQTIWYSTFLKNEKDLSKPGISDIFKVELVDAGGKVVQRSELVANNGFANGQLIINEKLAGGVYVMRAYTQWQNDLDEAYIFEKPIYIQEIGNNGLVADAAVEPYVASKKLNLQLSPEGGYLIAGLQTRVGLKVTDANGKGIDIAGALYDGFGQRLGKVDVEHDGLGSFVFIPMANEQYTVKLDNGQTFELPDVLNDGALIAADVPSKDKLSVNLRSTKNRKVLLVGVLHGQIYYAAEHNLRAGDNATNILLDDMPPGVLHLSLYGENGLAYGERNVFVNAHKKLKVEVITDKALYMPRSMVQVKVRITDYDGNPVHGNFSMAVVDNQLYNQTIDNQSDIMANMLLLPEVSELVESPARYFDASNALAAKQLDLLLLNSNWRRYSWEDIYYTKINRPLRNPELAVVTGQLVDAVSGKPVVGASIINKAQKINAKTNSQGYFTIEGLDLTKSVELTISKNVGLMNYVINSYQQDLHIEYFGDTRTIYQPKQNGQLHPVLTGMVVLPSAGYPVVGQVLNAYGQGVSGAIVTALSNSKTVNQTVTDANGYYTFVLNEIKKYDVRVETDRYGTFEYMNLSTKAGDVVLLDVKLSNSQSQLVNYQTNFPFQDSSYIKNRYSFLAASVNIYNTSLNVDNAPAAIDAWNNSFTGGTAYYIDGRKLSYNEPLYLTQSSIRYGSIWGTHEDVLNARRGDQAMNPTNNGMEPVIYNPVAFNQTSKPKGFGVNYLAAEQYPDISYPIRNKAKDRNDLRSTLYWNGNVSTNANGEAVLSFYTGDDLTTFRVIVEGMDTKGLTGAGFTTATIQAPCEVKVDAPDYVTVGQEIKVPVTFTNRAKDQMTGKFDFVIPNSLVASKPLPKDFTLFPLRRDTVWLTFTVVEASQQIDTLQVLFTADGYLRTDKAGIVTYAAEPID